MDMPLPIDGLSLSEIISGARSARKAEGIALAVELVEKRQAARDIQQELDQKNSTIDDAVTYALQQVAVQQRIAEYYKNYSETLAAKIISVMSLPVDDTDPTRRLVSLDAMRDIFYPPAPTITVTGKATATASASSVIGDVISVDSIVEMTPPTLVPPPPKVIETT